MANDIYFRGPNDPNYKEGIVTVSDDIENTLQQTRMTLLTKKGEVLGEPDFGFNMDKYLFEFDSYPASLINQEANEQIKEYVLMAQKYKVEANTFYLEGDDENRPSLVMEVLLDGKKSAFAALFDV